MSFRRILVLAILSILLLQQKNSANEETKPRITRRALLNTGCAAVIAASWAYFFTNRRSLNQPEEEIKIRERVKRIVEEESVREFKEELKHQGIEIDRPVRIVILPQAHAHPFPELLSPDDLAKANEEIWNSQLAQMEFFRRNPNVQVFTEGNSRMRVYNDESFEYYWKNMREKMKDLYKTEFEILDAFKGKPIPTAATLTNLQKLGLSRGSAYVSFVIGDLAYLEPGESEDLNFRALGLLEEEIKRHRRGETSTFEQMLETERAVVKDREIYVLVKAIKASLENQKSGYDQGSTIYIQFGRAHHFGKYAFGNLTIEDADFSKPKP